MRRKAGHWDGWTVGPWPRGGRSRLGAGVWEQHHVGATGRFSSTVVIP